MNVDKMEVIENISVDNIKKKSDEVSTLMESKKNSNSGVFMCFPVTPNLNKESGKVIDELSTPMEDVFDPCTRVQDPNQTSHPGSSAVRKLNFRLSECVSENEAEEGSLMETMYESVLESIICKEAEDIFAEILAQEANDEPRTPPYVARLPWVAETCPGAPLKPKQVLELTNVNTSLCRKLHFDS